MADLMNIIARLREATSTARKECDIQINKTVNDMTRDLKDKIIKHRDFQIKLIEESSNKSKKELEEMKKENYEAKINFIANKYKKNRVKQSKNFRNYFKLDRVNKKELEHLEKQLKKKLIEVAIKIDMIIQKMKSCRAIMQKPDETLIKINKMLSEIDNT
ncbi:uncharacterized protein TA10665 [Theileria annulata]|uniref:Uncharacterized protein n=1 Tax=Theileria annulata TaxID=5874 RepID=Q4U932_THEAN|nr:uncharacterized protein TA10665 [Theileria annulata]CAI76671.1 hypothetical protein TA10665 [Theileria annulata]|eukprot:XP_953296.1 hypothetical protein TA10665 [Theileria annulata]